MATSHGVVVCGEALIDLVPVSARSPGDGPIYRAVCGGSPYNVAIGLGRLGQPTWFLGRLSRDGNGRLLAQRLAQSGVSLDCVVSGAAPTTLACVFPPQPGRADVDYAFYVAGTSGAEFLAEDFPLVPPAGASVLHFGSFAALMPGSGGLIRDFARQSRLLVSYDPNIRPSLTPDLAQMRADAAACMAIADLVKLSDADAAWLYPGMPHDQMARSILQRGVRLVALTCGADGAILWTDRHRVAVPAPPVAVVDTVGAGDSFMATLLWALGNADALTQDGLGETAEAALFEIASLACRSASMVCGRQGADPPFVAELVRPISLSSSY